MTTLNVTRKPVTVIVQGRGLTGAQGDKGDPGNLTGPASSTDGNVPIFDGVGGNLLKDSGVKLSDKADVDDVADALADYAPLASPTLTGSPTAPTQAASDNSTKIATTKFVKDQAYYNKANILGTVSQSGGIPTGAVIERGNNTNGWYTKFADGTMICTLDSVFTAGQYEWTYPTVFAVRPQVVASPTLSNPSALFSLTVFATPGTSSAKFFGNVSTNGGTSWTSASTGLRLIAIGRWF